MALTRQEEIRMAELETKVVELHRLIRGAASKGQLDRLFVLLGREIERLEEDMNEIETDTAATLDLARKLQ